MFIRLGRGGASSGVGETGTFNFFNEYGTLEPVSLPSTSFGTTARPAFCTWKRGTYTRTYIFGQFTENMVVTEHKAFYRIGIQAPPGPFVNAVPVENQVGITASGTGLTGDCIFYRRFVDSLHNRRSPLSGPSPTLALVNQGISVVNAEAGPVPADAGVDTMEIWVSVDGGLPRYLASRDIGATAFLVNESVTGEAETDTMSQYPVLKFGVLANDALFAAGDDRAKNVLYVSRSGSPEEFTGITIPTRNGEEIIGLASIGGSTVYVQCPNSSYYVQGFDESDLVMKILEPSIGGLGHHTIALCHDVAVVPTQLGWYVCTGTSLFPIGFGEWDRTWRDTLNQTPDETDWGFAVTDLVSGSIKYLTGPQRFPKIIGFPTSGPGVSFNSIYWVLDIAGLVPQAGPGVVSLAFDARTGNDTAAAMLAVPGTLVGNLYTGDDAGTIYAENQVAQTDVTGGIAAIVHVPHYQMGEIAEEEDAFQVSKIWPIFVSERFEAIVKLYVGNDFAWQTIDPEVFTIPAGMDIFVDRGTPPVSRIRVPRSQLILTPNKQVAGSCASVRISVTLDTNVTIDEISYEDPISGLIQVVILDQRSQFIFYGLGMAWVGGVENRPESVFNPVA